MHLIDTYQGTLQDAYQWAIQHGMSDVGIERVQDGLTSLMKTNAWLAQGDPSRYFRFLAVISGQVALDRLPLDIINVGLWRLF